MREMSLTSDPSIRFIRRDARSFKEVADYISGKTAPSVLWVDDGKKEGLADQRDCPSVEESLRKMSEGDKLLVVRTRPGSWESLPTGMLLEAEDLRESGMRFLFYVKL